MSDDKCCFAEPILNGGFGCSRSSGVVRRAGPDIACQSSMASARCARMLVQLKTVGLPYFDCEDNPLTLPHSVLMKIKSGGLLGLQALLTGEDPRPVVVDVDALMQAAMDRFGDISAIPFERCTDAMKMFSVRRRSRRE